MSLDHYFRIERETQKQKKTTFEYPEHMYVPYTPADTNKEPKDTKKRSVYTFF